MSFELKYHLDVKSIDIPQLNEKLKKRIKHAIETRLTTAPHQYGEPLRKTLFLLHFISKFIIYKTSK